MLSDILKIVTAKFDKDLISATAMETLISEMASKAKQAEVFAKEFAEDLHKKGKDLATEYSKPFFNSTLTEEDKAIIQEIKQVTFVYRREGIEVKFGKPAHSLQLNKWTPFLMGYAMGDTDLDKMTKLLQAIKDAYTAEAKHTEAYILEYLRILIRPKAFCTVSNNIATKEDTLYVDVTDLISFYNMVDKTLTKELFKLARPELTADHLTELISLCNSDPNTAPSSVSLFFKKPSVLTDDELASSEEYKSSEDSAVEALKKHLKVVVINSLDALSELTENPSEFLGVYEELLELPLLRLRGRSQPKAVKLLGKMSQKLLVFQDTMCSGDDPR